MLIYVVVAKLIYYGKDETHHIMATREDLRNRNQTLQAKIGEHQAYIVELNTELNKVAAGLENLRLERRLKPPSSAQRN